MAKGRSLSAEAKALIAIESLKGEKEEGKIQQIAKQYGISTNYVQKLKKKLVERAPYLFSKEGELREEYKKLKELNFESIGQHKIQLNTILSKINKSFKAGIITSVGTMLMVIATFFLVFVNKELADSNRILADHTVKLAGYTEKMASSTSEMSKYTAKTAEFTGERNKLLKSPTLTIFCVIESYFTVNTYDGIKFMVDDYLRHRRDIQFFISVKNEWRFPIKDKIDIPFRILFLNREKEVVETYPPPKDGEDSPPYYIDDFSIQVGPNKNTEIRPVREITDKLSNAALQKNYTDKIIKIIIPDSDIKLHNYSYVEAKVNFVNYNAFKASAGIKSE